MKFTGHLDFQEISRFKSITLGLFHQISQRFAIGAFQDWQRKKTKKTPIDKNENKEVSFFGIFHIEKSLQSYIGAISMAVSKELKGYNISGEPYDLSW